jgi:predicted P-loop ATPase
VVNLHRRHLDEFQKTETGARKFLGIYLAKLQSKAFTSETAREAAISEGIQT